MRRSQSSFIFRYLSNSVSRTLSCGENLSCPWERKKQKERSKVYHLKVPDFLESHILCFGSCAFIERTSLLRGNIFIEGPSSSTMLISLSALFLKLHYHERKFHAHSVETPPLRSGDETMIENLQVQGFLLTSPWRKNPSLRCRKAFNIVKASTFSMSYLTQDNKTKKN